MAGYTPSAGFTFEAASYTPSANFEFVTTTVYDLTLSQSWALQAAVFSDAFLDQGWGLSVPVFSDGTLDHGWALFVPSFSDGSMDHRWAISVPAFIDGTLSQQWQLFGATDEMSFGFDWALKVFEFDDVGIDQRWSVLAPSFGDTALRQRWGLLAPTFKDTFMPLRWGLSAPTFANGALNHRWALSVPSFSDAAWSQRWSLAVYDYGDTSLDQRWALLIPTVAEADLSQLWRLRVEIVWTPVVEAIEYGGLTLAGASATTYTLTLTGAPDGLDDITLPMASFSTRMGSGKIYLQVSVPSARNYGDAVGSRLNGELIVSRGLRWSDGSVQVQEIARGELSLVNSDVGASSSSLSLQARATLVAGTPKTVTLQGLSYHALSGGKRRVRCSIDNSVRPGDTVIADDEPILVGRISHVVNVRQGYMEIGEA